MGRLSRQLATAQQLQTLVTTDEGFNPLQQRPVHLMESGATEEWYDEALAQCILKARDKGHARTMIDECLWVGAYYDLNPVARLAFVFTGAAEFRSSTADLTPDYLDSLEEEAWVYTKASTHPLARPCFTMDLPSDVMTDLITGRVQVCFLLNWDGFAELLSPMGCALRWEDPTRFMQRKPADRPLILQRGVPVVQGELASLMIGAPLLLRLYSDLLRPRSLASSLKADIETVEQEARDGTLRSTPY